MWPPDDTLIKAWKQLIADRDSAGNFATLILRPIVETLSHQFPRLDGQLSETASEDAVLAFLKRPESYDPTKLPLQAYLTMIASRRMLNLLKAEKRHHVERIPWDSIELSLSDGNANSEVEELPTFDSPELRGVIESFTSQERDVFDLLRDGERSTAVFAVALAISERPLSEQETEVKRVKDRIKARLKRAVGGDKYD